MFSLTSVCAEFLGSAHDAYILQLSSLPILMEGRPYVYEECFLLGG